MDPDPTHLSPFLYLHSHQYLPAASGSLPWPSSQWGFLYPSSQQLQRPLLVPVAALRWLKGQGCLTGAGHVVVLSEL